MVKIRLKRIGSRKRPYYRIVVTDSRNPFDGKSIEEIGYYHPIENGKFHIAKDRANAWIGYGAQLTDTVRDLFRKNSVLI